MYGPPPTNITIAEEDDIALIAEDPEEIEEAEEISEDGAADDEELIDDGDE